jgi:hypothetical protein
MKVLVAYLSQTGHTKQVTEAIYGVVEAEKELCPLSEVTSLAGYDLAFVGFPIHRSGPCAEAKEFLATRCAGQDIALFVTHASPEEAASLALCLAGCRKAVVGARVAGLFHCRGQLAQPVKEAMLKSHVPQLQAWAEADDSQRQPDAARLERARAFAREMMAAASDSQGQ